jgi:hypothetical protein
MSSSNRDDANPYAPPVAGGQDAGAMSLSAPDRALVTKFRQQIHALGAFWIFIGGLAIVLAAIGLAGNRGFVNQDRLQSLVLAVVGVIGMGWCLLGVLTCLKHLWAIYVGLALSYLSIPVQLLSLNLCGVAVLIVVVLQAHRVIGWANRMQSAGIPLTVRPS